jgi:hypothetical protein
MTMHSRTVSSKYCMEINNVVFHFQRILTIKKHGNGYNNINQKMVDYCQHTFKKPESGQCIGHGNDKIFFVIIRHRQLFSYHV